MTAQLERLSELYGFDSWRDARKSEESLFVWRFRLNGGEIEGWTAHRVQQVKPEGMPPANISLWRPTREGRAQLLSVDVYETESRIAAREHLLRLLGEFQGPQLKRRNALGDVAFSAGDVAVLFARANLVALVRSVERDLAPVAAVAAQLDQYILERPITVDQGGPRISVLAVDKPGGAAPDRPVVLVIELMEPERERAWFKLFSRSGDFRMEQGQPAFIPAGTGPHEIVVYAIGVTGAAGSRMLRLE